MLALPVRRAILSLPLEHLPRRCPAIPDKYLPAALRFLSGCPFQSAFAFAAASEPDSSLAASGSIPSLLRHRKPVPVPVHFLWLPVSASSLTHRIPGRCAANRSAANLQWHLTTSVYRYHPPFLPDIPCRFPPVLRHLPDEFAY